MDLIPEIVLVKSKMFGKKKRRHHKKQVKVHKSSKREPKNDTISIPSQPIESNVTISPRTRNKLINNELSDIKIESVEDPEKVPLSVRFNKGS